MSGSAPDKQAGDADKVTKTHRVFIVDDHPIVRNGLAQLLSQEHDLEVCGEADNAVEAAEAIGALQPDVALVDISLRRSNGIELTKTLKTAHPNIPVLVLSMHDENIYAERALRAGAKGFVMKQEAAETVLRAVRRVAAGDVYVSETIMARMLQEFVGAPATTQQSSGIETLTDRELEVFEFVGQGVSTREIAEKLHLSIKTVETHRAHLKQKLNLANATELLHYAMHWVENEHKPKAPPNSP